MTPAEQVAIAHIARYHRGSAPKKSHRAFAQLDRVLRDRIVRLSALLRFADGFDRGHIGAVARLKLRWASDALRVSVEQAESASTVRLECWGASRKRGLLEFIIGRPVEVIAPDGTVVSFDEGDGE
jgi:exopolyphosphatase/guanosine-5'-triphosphate,3'-diphosphate pyrophosphatase